MYQYRYNISCDDDNDCDDEKKETSKQTEST